MAKFAKSDAREVAKSQAANVIMQIQGSVLPSVGTARNYEERLGHIAQFANEHFKCGLRELTPNLANQYLAERALEVGQKTLDMERQALQAMMRHVTHQLDKDGVLDTSIKSEQQQVLTSRMYTGEQLNLIANCQTERNALATEIAHAAGLRAHELYTLHRIEERSPSERPAREEKFAGRTGERYTVEGKGGLVREVLIPSHLSERLEQHRLNEPMQITDRNIHYQSNYDISGGNRWSSSFSAASNRALNWSAGAHGARHSYAQERMYELQKDLSYRDALEVVSQEMGHFRPEITEVYLR